MTTTPLKQAGARVLKVIRDARGQPAPFKKPKSIAEGLRLSEQGKNLPALVRLRTSCIAFEKKYRGAGLGTDGIAEPEGLFRDMLELMVRLGEAERISACGTEIALWIHELRALPSIGDERFMLHAVQSLPFSSQFDSAYWRLSRLCPEVYLDVRQGGSMPVTGPCTLELCMRFELRSFKQPSHEDWQRHEIPITPDKGSEPRTLAEEATRLQHLHWLVNKHLIDACESFQTQVIPLIRERERLEQDWVKGLLGDVVSKLTPAERKMLWAQRSNLPVMLAGAINPPDEKVKFVV